MTLGMQIAKGFETVAFCEINPFCQEILSQRFKNVPIISNIKDVSTTSLRHLSIQHIDGIAAGLPCPPFSLAGKRMASQDERNLFDEFFRILGDVRPRWAVLENVPGLLSAEKGEYFRRVVRRFAEMGYLCLWGICSAAAVGAVHLRKRIWIIAYSQDDGWGASGNDRLQEWSDHAPISCSVEEAIADTSSNRCEGQLENACQERSFPELHDGSFNPIFPQPAFCGDNDGLSSGLDGCLLRRDRLEEWLSAATIPSFSRLSGEEIRSLAPEEQAEYRQLYREYQTIRRQNKEQLKALGNAVVPQCAAKIFEMIPRIKSS